MSISIKKIVEAIREYRESSPDAVEILQLYFDHLNNCKECKEIFEEWCEFSFDNSCKLVVKWMVDDAKTFPEAYTERACEA